MDPLMGTFEEFLGRENHLHALRPHLPPRTEVPRHKVAAGRASELSTTCTGKGRKIRVLALQSRSRRL